MTIEIGLLIGIILLSIALLVVGITLIRLSNRYHQFRDQAGTLMRLQQDTLAQFDARLGQLGSRNNNPVPTAEELEKSTWLR